MGVRGAALATILSQLLSALWILSFLTGKRAILKLKPGSMKLDGKRILRITGLGMSGFTMAITNSSVQIMYNAMLQKFGGDLYVGVMTVINSVREVISMPVNGLTNSAQPVMGYNYGAGEYGRVRKAIVFMSFVCILYTLGAWGIVHEFPEFFIRIFNREGELVEAGIPAMRVYFFGFFYDVPAICRAVGIHRAGKIEECRIFFDFPEGYYCDSPDFYTALHIGNGNHGNTDGGTYLQFYWRSRLLWNHAFYCMAGTETASEYHRIKPIKETNQ